MKNLVFSRTKKVRRSFVVDDQIIQKYVTLYGIPVREARRKYKTFILSIQLSKPHLYATNWQATNRYLPYIGGNCPHHQR